MKVITRLFAATAALCLTGIGLTGTANAASEHTRLPRCTNADLVASYRPSDAAMGTDYGYLRLTNVSSHSCFVRGFGGLSLVGHGNGTQIGAAATRVGRRAPYAVVRPNHHVRSLVAIGVAQNYPRRLCHPRKVDGFRVYVPDATKSQFVPFQTTGCARMRVHLIRHTAYGVLTL